MARNLIEPGKRITGDRSRVRAGGRGRKRMLRDKGFIFTNKKHTEKGIMSTILGVLAGITLGLAVYFSYSNGGRATERDAAAALLAVIFMSVGLVLGIWSTSETDKFKLFTLLGIIVNVLAFAMLSLILFAGAYVK